MKARTYKPSRLLTDFKVRGMCYWDGPLVVQALQPGATLDLVPEPDNPYDPQALALYLGENKIGFIPRELNNIYSSMLFYGHKNVFQVRIISVDSQNPIESGVHVGIYVVDNKNE